MPRIRVCQAVPGAVYRPAANRSFPGPPPPAVPCNQRGHAPMSAIPVAGFMRPVAMILGPTPQTRCNDLGHEPPRLRSHAPMIAVRYSYGYVSILRRRPDMSRCWRPVGPRPTPVQQRRHAVESQPGGRDSPKRRIPYGKLPHSLPANPIRTAPRVSQSPLSTPNHTRGGSVHAYVVSPTTRDTDNSFLATGNTPFSSRDRLTSAIVRPIALAAERTVVSNGVV